MFVFDNWNKTFIVGGLFLIAAGLVMAYLKSPRHDSESTLFWVFSIATLIGIFWCVGVADDEKYVRYFALAFTIAGLFAAFYPLMDARMTLQKPGVIESLRVWIAQPFKTVHVVLVAGSGELNVQAGTSTVTATGTLTTHPNGMSPNERITLIENQVAALESKHAQEVAAIHREATNAETSAQQRYEAQINAANRLRQLFVDLQTGGLAVIWWGLVWLVIGGTLGGLAPEIAHFLKWWRG